MKALDWIVASLLASGLAALPARVATAGEVAYTGSLQGATGSYELSDRTNSVYLVNGLWVRAGRWRLAASVPLYARSVPTIGIAASPPDPGGEPPDDPHHGHGGGPGGAAPTATVSGQAREAGLGDPQLRTELEVRRVHRRSPSVRLAAAVKLPLSRGRPADGTGEWDYGAGIVLAQRWGRGYAFADLTGWVRGDLPNQDVRDALVYAVAYGRALGAGDWTVLGSIYGATPIEAGTDPPAQAGLMLMRWLGWNRGLSASVVVGITEAAPDAAFALGWRLGL